MHLNLYEIIKKNNFYLHFIISLETFVVPENVVIIINSSSLLRTIFEELK